MLLRKKGDPINPTHQRRDDEIEGPREIESQNLRHVIIELGLNSTVTRVALVSWSISDRHRFQPKPKKKKKIQNPTDSFQNPSIQRQKNSRIHYRGAAEKGSNKTRNLLLLNWNCKHMHSQEKLKTAKVG